MEKAAFVEGQEPPAKTPQQEESGASQFDKLNVYVRARLIPVGLNANARPWIKAGPVRAWSADFEKRSSDGKPVGGLWLCSKSAALYMSASQVSTTNEGHNKIWFTHDGLLMHYTAELIAGCKEHRDPRNAVKLYNNLISTAWARVPSEMRDSRLVCVRRSSREARRRLVMDVAGFGPSDVCE